MGNVLSSFDWKEFASGWAAAVVNITVTYPISKIIFRQITHNLHSLSALRYLYDEGFLYLYRGILPPLLQRTASLSLTFGIYYGSFNFLTKNTSLAMLNKKIIAGAFTGVAESIFIPFERIQTLLVYPENYGRFSNMGQVFMAVKPFGLKEFYRGSSAIVCRNVPASCLFFILRDQILVLLPKNQSGVHKAGIDFIAGSLTGASTSTALYPFTVFKIQMQQKLGGDFEGLFKVARRLYMKRGRNLYHGAPLNFCRSFLSWGIVSTVYEVFKNILHDT